VPQSLVVSSSSRFTLKLHVSSSLMAWLPTSAGAPVMRPPVSRVVCVSWGNPALKRSLTTAESQVENMAPHLSSGPGPSRLRGLGRSCPASVGPLGRRLGMHRGVSRLRDICAKYFQPPVCSVPPAISFSANSDLATPRWGACGSPEGAAGGLD
jgi:hypothetical protein